MTSMSGGGGGGSAAVAFPLDPTSAGTGGDLFAGTTLDPGWSALQSTAVGTVDRTNAGYLYLKNTTNTAGQDRGLQRAYAPAGNFSVWTKITSASLGLDFQWAGLFIGA